MLRANCLRLKNRRAESTSKLGNSQQQHRTKQILSVIYCDKVEERVLPILSTIDRLVRGWKPTQRYERASVRRLCGMHKIGSGVPTMCASCSYGPQKENEPTEGNEIPAEDKDDTARNSCNRPSSRLPKAVVRGEKLEIRSLIRFPSTAVQVPTL